jgi:glycosyltransferase involved in cell wall biosynthesis
LNISGSLPVIERITPLIITYNEEPNIARTLEKLRWARRIVLIDSGSTDATAAIAARYPQVEVIVNPFAGFAEQCNFGLSHILTEWVLSLDADYELSDALVQELHALGEEPRFSGYSSAFVYRLHGRALRGSLYPPRTVLYRVAGAHYVNEGHGHRIIVAGEVGKLRAPIYHDDRKPLSHWFQSQQNYARLEAEYLMRAPRSQMSYFDKIRGTGCLAPIIAFFYVLFVKGCILDGRAGWFYAMQRVLAETLIALEVLDRRFFAMPDRISSEG